MLEACLRDFDRQWERRRVLLITPRQVYLGYTRFDRSLARRQLCVFFIVGLHDGYAYIEFDPRTEKKVGFLFRKNYTAVLAKHGTFSESSRRHDLPHFPIIGKNASFPSSGSRYLQDCIV